MGLCEEYELRLQESRMKSWFYHFLGKLFNFSELDKQTLPESFLFIRLLQGFHEMTTMKAFNTA